MEIEIKVMWCKGLTGFNFFQKLTLYASVSIKCEGHRFELTSEQIQEQKTPVDEDGGSDPEWNHTMVFDLSRLNSVSPNLDHLSFLFEFRHRGQFLGDKTVGDVSVPLRSLIDSAGFGVTRFVSYEVRSPDGKHNGILDFSYKVIDKSIHLVNNAGSLPSEIHVSGYNNVSYGTSTAVEGQIIRHDHQRYQLDVHSSSEVERIEYPRIDLDDWTASSSALVATNVSPYPPPAQTVYPPRPLQHQWGPPPQQPPYFQPPPPPPPPPPVVYPPRPYGESHWGYYRPPSGGCGGCHRW